jgi:hypothetical protein
MSPLMRKEDRVLCDKILQPHNRLSYPRNGRCAGLSGWPYKGLDGLGGLGEWTTQRESRSTAATTRFNS